MDLATMIEHCAPTVAPATMQRIVQVESAFQPHAIGYHLRKGGQAYRLNAQPRDRAEAIAWARWLLEQGYRFDAGAAQINSQHFGRLGLTPENLFDVCTNLGAAGRILSEFYQAAVRQYGVGQSALRAALSAYQTGSFTRGYRTGYVQRVVGTTGKFPSLVEPQGRRDSAQRAVSPQQAPTGVTFNPGIRNVTNGPCGSPGTVTPWQRCH